MIRCKACNSDDNVRTYKGRGEAYCLPCRSSINLTVSEDNSRDSISFSYRPKPKWLEELEEHERTKDVLSKRDW